MRFPVAPDLLVKQALNDPKNELKRRFSFAREALRQKILNLTHCIGHAADDGRDL